MNHEECLTHHGIKGQKWGVRRWQNKDGSLTKAGQKRYNKEVENLKTEKKKLRNQERTRKKLDKLKKMEEEVDDLKKGVKREESPEAKREHLLKETDPKELYKNKDLLTTAELNERINRIDTEARLKSKIVEEHEKTGMEYLNDKMQSASKTINNVSNLFKSVDSAYSSVANSAIGKQLAKQLGIETPKKDFNLEEFWKNRNKKSTQEILDVNKRLMAEESIKKKMNADAEAKSKAESAEAAQKAQDKAYSDAKKQVDDYYEKWQKSGENSTYHKSGRDIKDNRTYTRENDPKTTPLLDYVEKYETTGKDVVGKGKSTFTGWDKPPATDAIYDGERYVSGVLGIEDKSKK
jgi:hypothetical protein